MARTILSLPPELTGNPEFQSALVRIGIWLFSLCYVGIGAMTGQYHIDYAMYLSLFGAFLVLNVGILVSVLREPVWEARRYAAQISDILATTFAIFLVQDAASPFYAVYILIFISAGTRYGRRHLAVASAAAVICYSSVMFVLGAWSADLVNAIFRILILLALPFYQAGLLRQLHNARETAERARKAAEEASHAKGQFVARMSHELRTPLVGVQGNAELLLTTPLDAEQHDYVTTIIASSNTLLALIGDILDLSRIEAAQLRLEQAPFDPRATLLEVCEGLHPLALDKSLELVCDVDGAVPRAVLGDALRVRQILFNLIGNAVKFTEHGEVRVTLGASPSAPDGPPLLLISVTDTGIGIAAEQLDGIFESFRQADESTTRRYGGSGLGTTIARDLTRLMDGEIAVASTPGQGTSFTVHLPLPAVEPEPATAAADAPEPDDLSGLRVLICEASPSLRLILAETCRGLGAECLVAASPADVPTLVAQAPSIDLAILGDSPAHIDLPALIARLGALLGAEPTTLCLTYRQRRAQLTAPTRRCLNKPFLREDLIAAIGQARHPLAASDGPCCPPPGKGNLPLASAGTRVLVAEDNAIAARVTVKMIENQGGLVTLVNNGQAALSAALSGGFAVAFVDLHMPGMDGLEFIHALRAHEREHDGHLHVIALTANACADVREECLAAGMDGFLSKPVSAVALRDALLRHGGDGPPAAAPQGATTAAPEAQP